MQAQYVNMGQTIPHAPQAAVAAGDVVVVGDDLVAIAHLDIAAGASGVLSLTGLYDVVKDDSDVAAGDKLYWDDDGDPVGGDSGSGAFTSDPSLGPFAGYALTAAGTTVGTVRLRLAAMGGFGPQPGGWDITNFTEDKQFAGDSTTAADAVKAVASLVKDLIDLGIVGGTVAPAG